MILDLKRVIIELQYRGIVSVGDAVGTRIDCLRGQLWITEGGSSDDIVLRAGESHVISRGGVTVVQALQEALVGLRASVAHPDAAGVGVTGLWNALAARATDAVSTLVQPRAG